MKEPDISQGPAAAESEVHEISKAKCRVLVADPPWQFQDPLPGKARGAAKNYGTLSVQEIMRFPLPEFEPDALLLLWRVSSMVEEAYQVVRAWGFVPKSEIIWAKRTKDDKPWFGMGRYVRASHESCIVAVRGRFKVTDRSIRSGFVAKVPVGPDGQYIHSGKPPEFYGIVERLSPGPYVELFARNNRPGWECFGHQLPTP